MGRLDGRAQDQGDAEEDVLAADAAVSRARCVPWLRPAGRTRPFYFQAVHGPVRAWLAYPLQIPKPPAAATGLEPREPETHRIQRHDDAGSDGVDDPEPPAEVSREDRARRPERRRRQRDDRG